MDTITRVLNLRTGDERTYVGPTAAEAVRAAYAQERNDYNTWDYERIYGALVVHGQRTISCGDWTTPTEVAR